ncbi:hypothetical protein B0H14DRAFT_3099260 [Mycena olivaceomarginata]|nr:hypothetical protein B0H14DRAFT_3099260 [Mycena olivaceomarginata]
MRMILQPLIAAGNDRMDVEGGDGKTRRVYPILASRARRTDPFRLPPSFGIRHFDKGISSLSQVSGKERKAMARILLGCLVGRLPVKGIRACRAILDFIYLSQYTTHDDGTLASLRDALEVWHENRDFFITRHRSRGFNIPKFHSLLHYVDSIQYFGTTDNYNTEMFERLHIDFAKMDGALPNRRDEFPQMITWLGRQEKISSPQSPRLPLAQIELRHHTNSFIHTLKDFLNNLNPIATRIPANRLRDAVLPFTNLDVYHNFKFEPCALDPGAEADENDTEDPQTVISRPGLSSTPPRFDTVVVRIAANAEATGLSGTRAGRVKVLFQLPQKFDDNTPVPTNWPTSCLAYVEWYSSFSPRHDDNHTMYSISTVPSLRANGFANASIVHLTDIRQTCQLCDRDWTTDTVLDQCTAFYLNNWGSMYAYKSIWVNNLTLQLMYIFIDRHRVT